MPLPAPTHIPPPDDIAPLARAVLDALASTASSSSVAASLVIGGGVALQHYVNLRPTVDLDLWWTHEPSAADQRGFREVIERIARDLGFTLRERTHGDVSSLAFFYAEGSRRESDGESGRAALPHAVFSVDVARRDVQIAPYRESAWPPVLLESLMDNVAAKMVALSARGHRRDFADVFAVVNHGLLTADDCWTLWSRKQQGLGREPDIVSGKVSVLSHLARLTQTRPLERISDPTERRRASAVRAWFEDAFAAQTPRSSEAAREIAEGAAEAPKGNDEEGSRPPAAGQ